MGLTKDELKALKWVGVLGHEFVVLDNDLRCRAECNTLESAQKTAGKEGTVFQQLPKRQWRKL